ncbi:MAG: carbohydrate ABC transporter permease [Acidimicrobiia bacterium]
MPSDGGTRATEATGTPTAGTTTDPVPGGGIAVEEERSDREEVVVVPGGDLLEAREAGLTGATVGQSPARRVLGLTGQYAALVVLAAVVLAPVVLTLVQALSRLFPWINAGKPLHPVDVQWKDRTWLSGGAWSVTARTLVIVLMLAWVQLRVAGGNVRRLAPLATPRRLAAVGAGVVATAALADRIWAASLGRATTTAWWWLAAILAVAATQLAGFGGLRTVWRPALLAALTGVAVVAFAVLAFGAQAWSQGWDTGDLGPPMVRSFTVTVLITVAQVLTSILAAYAFAFLRFPAKGLVFALFMGTLLLPIEVTLLGNVQTIRELDWINSNAGLVLPFAATAFGTFLIRQGFRGVPPEIRDATRLDGYGHLSFLWRFAVPLTRPVIASFVLISALGAWNQYLWPQAVIDDDRYQTAQIRLRSIVGAADPANANVQIAAALIVAIPVVLLLIAFQRQIIRGLTAGAVKG